VGLGSRTDHYPGQLSGGEQQRVALARAIAPKPAVLFADEPTGNLDGETGAGVADLLFALHARARSTLFLVTHEESLAKRCQRIVRLKDGRIVADELSA
jgi:putative ABC transport system ATP-binding protein